MVGCCGAKCKRFRRAALTDYSPLLGHVAACRRVLRVQGYRFFFVSHDRPEPPHIHVERGDASAKFWLERCQLAHNHGFPMHELANVLCLLRERRDELPEAWYGFFGDA